MALLDFLKKKEQAKKSEKKTEKISAVKKSDKGAKQTLAPSRSEEKKETPVARTSGKGFSFDIVKEPHISEKGSYLAEENQYIFKVSPDSNKQEIKKSISGIYGVDVLSVNIVNIPSKKRRLGKTQGFRKGYKKAIVKIKEGQKIEIL